MQDRGDDGVAIAPPLQDNEGTAVGGVAKAPPLQSKVDGGVAKVPALQSQTDSVAAKIHPLLPNTADGGVAKAPQLHGQAEAVVAKTPPLPSTADAMVVLLNLPHCKAKQWWCRKRSSVGSGCDSGWLCGPSSRAKVPRWYSKASASPIAAKSRFRCKTKASGMVVCSTLLSANRSLGCVERLEGANGEATTQARGRQ